MTWLALGLHLAVRWVEVGDFLFVQVSVMGQTHQGPDSWATRAPTAVTDSLSSRRPLLRSTLVYIQPRDDLATYVQVTIKAVLTALGGSCWN